MSRARYEELSGNNVGQGPPSAPRQRTHSRLRAGSSPEKWMDSDQPCSPNPCRFDEGPVDCKTLSVRQRLAEELGCCDCPKAETPCLVAEKTNMCCRARSSTPKKRCPSPKTNTCIDPVDQIVNEGLQLQKPSRRRSSSSRQSGRDRSGRDRCGRQAASKPSYQPDYFDDQADMTNWQEHRANVLQSNVTREQPRGQTPQTPNCSLDFQPYVDEERSSPMGAAERPREQTLDEVRQSMQVDLEWLNRHREKLAKYLELQREQQAERRAARRRERESARPREDRERRQRKIDDEKRKLHEFQQHRQPDGRCAAPSGTYEIPAETQSPQSPTRCSPSPARNRGPACASTDSTPRNQRRKLTYQPPSPSSDTNSEDECCPPPQRKRLQPLAYDSSSDECDRSRSAAESPQSSMQDSLMYYYRAIRNGAPPVTNPQQQARGQCSRSSN